MNQFSPFHDGADLYWIFFIRVKRSWKQVSVRKYQGIYYFAATGRISFSYPTEFLHVELVTELEIWAEELAAYRAKVVKDPIEAQALLLQALPMELRMGLMLRRNVRLLMPEWADIDLGVEVEEKQMLMDILNSPDGEAVPRLTAERYFEYCRIAYLANPKTFQDFNFAEGYSGREYYQRFADGRDGGLLSVEPTSEEALKKWYTGGAWSGAHPWEIYRGGNSTHINLSITCEYRDDNWKIVLNAFSTTRMVETCRIAIALKKAGLPFTLDHKKSYLNRILEEDWVGIVPEDMGIKYAFQNFPREYEVADCVHLHWFFESQPKEERRHIKKRLKKLAFWLPEKMSSM